MDQSGMDNMIDTENIVEEVIASTNTEEETFMTSETVPGQGGNETDMNQQYLNVQEAIFNPETGTLQPITAVTTSAPTPTPPSPPKTVKKASKSSTSQQQV